LENNHSLQTEDSAEGQMSTRAQTQSQSQSQSQSQGVYISTYGCQMNVNDTERMYSLLEMANYTPVQTPEEASVIIVNSCSIREKPVHIRSILKWDVIRKLEGTQSLA
jgi:hypothetical protein